MKPARSSGRVRYTPPKPETTKKTTEPAEPQTAEPKVEKPTDG